MTWFSTFGTVTDVYFPPKEGPLVIAFVTFNRPTAVVRALQAEHVIRGVELHVTLAVYLTGGGVSGVGRLVKLWRARSRRLG